MVLVGTHPVLTQVPPKSLRSITATFDPAFARRAARGGPACPVPITIASKVVDLALVDMAVSVSVYDATIGQAGPDPMEGGEGGTRGASSFSLRWASYIIEENDAPDHSPCLLRGFLVRPGRRSL